MSAPRGGRHPAQGRLSSPGQRLTEYASEGEDSRGGQASRRPSNFQRAGACRSSVAPAPVFTDTHRSTRTVQRRDNSAQPRMRIRGGSCAPAATRTGPRQWAARPEGQIGARRPTRCRPRCEHGSSSTSAGQSASLPTGAGRSPLAVDTPCCSSAVLRQFFACSPACSLPAPLAFPACYAHPVTCSQQHRGDDSYCYSLPKTPLS